ncbi:MAG: hypothetical protein ACREQN_16995, partial [Candidatus Binataceae bacterium]
TALNAVVEQPIKVNGEVVANRMKQIGSLEITEVHGKVSFAKIGSHTAALTVGTKVIQSAKPSVKTAGDGAKAPSTAGAVLAASKG